MSTELKRTYPCRYDGCFSVFKKKAHLVRHTLIHTDERPYICDYVGCRASFRSSSHLKRHAQSHSGEKNFRCPHDECGMAFSHKWNLKRHIKRTHNGPFKCSKCDKEFKKNKLLQSHMAMEHTASNICCNFPGCGAVFKVPSKLKQHAKMHNQGYICSVKGCSMKFQLWSECRQHAAICKTKEMNCEICGKTFSHKQNLKEHGKIHLEEREVYQCTYQGCGRFYTKQFNLKVHIQSFHQNIRPYICPKRLCNKSFHFQHLLRRHLEMHARKPDQIKEAPKKRRRTRRVNTSLISKVTGFIPELWTKMTPEEVRSYVYDDDTKAVDSDSDIVKEITTTQNTCTPVSSDNFLSDTTLTATENENMLHEKTFSGSSDTWAAVTGEVEVSNDEERMILEPCRSIDEAIQYLEKTKKAKISSSNSSNSPPLDSLSKCPGKFADLTNRLKKITEERQRESSSSSNVSLHSDSCRIQSLTESDSDSEMQKKVQLLMQQCAS